LYLEEKIKATSMAIDLYQPFFNPITKETFRCISSTEDSYTMQWTVHPGGYVPFEHIHINQDEIFHVEQGEIHVRIEGKEHVGKVGDTVIVRRGARHIARNEAPEILVCIVDYKPGLDQHKIMQCFAGLTLDHELDGRGLVNVPKVMYLMKRANAQSLVLPSFVPRSFFRLGMHVFFVIGAVMGWERLYEKYTS
jgi:quercetin dioxygenase-like cupin family protein